ncbi:MAG TPA: hypothetical protein VFU73_11760 [Actinocrinis sp.]|nr:hypothetical protein [Actinocrinis sp.]
MEDATHSAWRAHSAGPVPPAASVQPTQTAHSGQTGHPAQPAHPAGRAHSAQTAHPAHPTTKTSLNLRALLGAAGAAMLGYGAWGILHGAHESALESIGRWLLGGLILHDAVLAPFVFIAGYVAYRITGPRLRRALAAVLLVGGSALLVSLPEFLLPPGNTNPTVHPLNYARDFAIVGGSVILAAALYVLLATRHERSVARRRAFAEARRRAEEPEEAEEAEEAEDGARRRADEEAAQSLQSEEAEPAPRTQEPIPSADA